MYKGYDKLKMVACDMKEIIDEVRGTIGVIYIYDLRGTIYDCGSLYL